MNVYIPRSLTYLDSDGKIFTLHDSELPNQPAPLVVLGDPGMGKTSLLKNLGKRPEFHYVTAGKFGRTPLKCLPTDAVLVLDALDEVSSRVDGDALDALLAKLGEAGYPEFVISCRAADWKGSTGARDIAQDYGRSVRVLTLLPLTDGQAMGLLTATLGRSEAEQFYWVLRDHGLQELLHNPQTLNMLLKVAPDGVPKGICPSVPLPNSARQSRD